ncbi:Zn-ribbon domain-containing OB-fold protein [Mycobacterium sp.]|uniref:Zn-ribbon domain-containing OB-fold protein n=1 Tax=Mycobacterium sp. TaxID=1785 RepID=UPI002F411ACD
MDAADREHSDYYVGVNMLPRPAPVVTDDNEGFWIAASQRRFVAQRCNGCSQLHHPPRPMCPHCRSLDHEWVELSGRGTLYSYALLHYPQHPAFTYPLAAAVVELEEGLRFVTNVVNIDPNDLAIGMALAVTFVEIDDEMALPVFEPRRES